MSTAPARMPADQVVHDAGYDDRPPEPSRRMEVAVAVVAVVFMATALVLAQRVELRREAVPGQVDARFLPEMLALVGLALAGWRLVIAVVASPDGREDQERVQPGGYLRVALTVLASVVFIALWDQRTVTALGYRTELFPIITLLLLVVLVWLYGGRGVRALVIFPVLMTAGIYLLFDLLLRIPL